MDQQEKDWLDLGRKLKGYHPTGNPKDDFQALQELQNQQPDRKRRGLVYWGSENFVLLALLPLLGLIAFSVGKGQWERFQRNAPSEELSFTDVESPGDESSSEEVYTEIGPTEISVESVEPENQLVTVDPSPKPKRVENLAKTRITLVQGNPQVIRTHGPVEVTAESNLPIDFAKDTPASMELLDNQPADRVEMVLQRLPIVLVDPVSRPMNPLKATSAVISKQPSNLQITLGAGLSNHWRGANFMQEVDRGIYAYIGLNRRLGQRLGLEGRLGYRGHGMQLPVVSDVDGPWSYHKEEIHNTGHQGEDREYIYEGVVEGYQAVEFSLLANYQLSRRLSLSGGVRYSLPDLAFERTVMGPDEENPFFEFIERQPLVKYQDYGALLGVEYHFSRHLAIEAGLHLGMVDLIDDAAAGRARFNHSSSLSLGIRYKLD